jgi:beta-N-acetylhexosaminidase
MTTDEKVGQLVLAGLAGRGPAAAARDLVGRRKVGGVILYAADVGTPAQVLALTERLQGAAGEVPLLIAVDHEGGRINRFRRPVTRLPEAWTMGETGDPPLVRECGRVAGEELLAMGINVDLAPVLDVNDEPSNPVIGRRAFGDEPGMVARFGTAFAAGLRDEGVVAVGKHFPGHGHTTTDSHQTLPVVTRSGEGLESIDLVPFRAAISQGIDALMTAHVVYTSLDPDQPATLSPGIIGTLLRGELGYDGVVMTDALEMAAISDSHDRGEAAVGAILAGADIVLVSDEPELAIAALRTAVRDGSLPEQRLDASVRRILRLKLTHASGWAKRPPLTVIGSPEHLAVVEQVDQLAGAPG